MAIYLFVEHAACDTRVEAGDTLTLKSMYVKYHTLLSLD
eukprot:SAG25_NODE_791_length_5300_cov_1.525476_1_plen_39_part_00